MYHVPVLLNECIDGLSIKPDGTYVDVTFGGGGHSKAILEKLDGGRLLAFDQDVDALRNKIDDSKFTLINHNFRYLKNFLRYYNVEQVDAVFADLGVSSHDFDVPERGFSFRYDGKLDMRMNQKADKDASHVINTFSAEKLASVFKVYGEIKNARRLADQIVKQRSTKPIETTTELKEIALRCARKATENKYLAQVFQAIRIEVNDELEALKEFFFASVDVLKKNGRLVVITYHSLEDRLCKNFMKTGNFEGRVEKDFYGNPITPFRIINRKVIIPTEEEINNNSRARSAKLRIAEKI